MQMNMEGMMRNSKESLRKYLEREGFQKMNEVEICSEDFSG